MSATICPSCFSRTFEAGRCGKCGFTAAEYKPARTALPMGSIAGKYRFGLMKFNSRQSQVYTAVHNETSTPVIIEEFFPVKVAGRAAGSDEVALSSGDPELVQRYQQACLLIEASTQKRPLKRIDVFRANNTVYSVFEPVGTIGIAAQCEMMSDNPYYFRDQNGQPLMTINALPIPEMPLERKYDPTRYSSQSPVTRPEEDEGLIQRQTVIAAVENHNKKRKFIMIGCIAAAVVLIAAIIVVLVSRSKNGGSTPITTETESIQSTPTPSPTPSPSPTPTEVPTPTPAPIILSREEFINLLQIESLYQGDSVHIYAREIEDVHKSVAYTKKQEATEFKEYQFRTLKVVSGGGKDDLIHEATFSPDKKSKEIKGLFVIVKYFNDEKQCDQYFRIPIAEADQDDDKDQFRTYKAEGKFDVIVSFDTWDNMYFEVPENMTSETTGVPYLLEKGTRVYFAENALSKLYKFMNAVMNPEYEARISLVMYDKDTPVLRIENDDGTQCDFTLTVLGEKETPPPDTPAPKQITVTPTPGTPKQETEEDSGKKKV